MRQACYIAIVLLGIAISARSQTWGACSNQGSGNTACIQNANVGVGTAAPLYPLDFEANGGVGTGNYGLQWLGRTSITESGVILGYHANGSIADYPIVRAGGEQASGLALAGDSVNQAEMFIKNGGNVGIGTTSPASQTTVSGLGQATGNLDTAGSLAGALELDDTGYYAGNGGALLFSAGTQAWKFAAIKGYVENGGGNSQGAIVFAVRPSATASTLTEAMRVDYSGNVGIGTTNPVHPLQVAGAIGAEEVIVSSTGADYVFSPDYRLKPLAEVADYVKENHHLPDIPSADQMKEQGVRLGDMQTKLLAKVEELTLHLIQEDQRSDKLEQQNRELKERLVKLEALQPSAVAVGGGQSGH